MLIKLFTLGLFSLVTVELLTGCAVVEPWDRNTLAQESMSVEPDPLWAGWKQHSYSSREGTEGATGLSGGGCGCT